MQIPHATAITDNRATLILQVGRVIGVAGPSFIGKFRFRDVGGYLHLGCGHRGTHGDNFCLELIVSHTSEEVISSGQL